MKKRQLEIACFGLYSVALAQTYGADRIELCENMEEGGTTPTFTLVAAARNITQIPLFVMIRPRGGNFVYSDEEFKLMQHHVQLFKEIGVDGFVFGILNLDGTIDKDRNASLVNMAGNLPSTFHRAFDDVLDIEKGLENLIEIGFSAVLTSGKEKNAISGLSVLEKLVVQANDRIEIIPGGRIRTSNIKMLSNALGKRTFHSAAVLDQSNVPSIEEIKSLKNLLAS